MNFGPQLDHALLDWDCFAKAKMVTLRMRFGHQARLWFVDCILAMSQATSATIPRDIAVAMAREVGVQEPEQLLEYCLGEEIFRQLNDYIFNDRVIEDRLKLESKRTKGRNKKRQQRDKEGDRQGDPVTVTEGYKSKKIEVGFSETLTFGAGAFPAEVTTRVFEWQIYSEKVLRKPFGQIQADALISRYSGRIHDLARDIEASISNSWRTVRDCSQEKLPSKMSPGTSRGTYGWTDRCSTVPRSEESARKIAQMKAQASTKPVEQLLTDEQKQRLEKLKGAA